MAERFQAALPGSRACPACPEGVLPAVIVSEDAPRAAAWLESAVRAAVNRPFCVLGMDQQMSVCIGIALCPLDRTVEPTSDKMGRYRADIGGRVGDTRRPGRRKRERSALYAGDVVSPSRTAGTGVGSADRFADWWHVPALPTQKSVGRTASWSVLKPCCAGITRRKARSHPARSSPWRKRTGIIVPLGNWVIREACRQLAEWRRSRSYAGARCGQRIPESTSRPADVRAAGADGGIRHRARTGWNLRSPKPR